MGVSSRAAKRAAGPRRALIFLAVSAAWIGTVVLLSPAAEAATSPVAPRSSGVVTADLLPTVQIDGVVWSQAVVGNTVYAGGSFANARPAGAAAGTSLTPRANLLAYDITTGVLKSSFVPSLNAQVKVVAASPDGTRIYVGGSFTTANGQSRSRIAAYSTSTGALITSFAPVVSSTVNAIAATNSTVYIGGAFTTVNGVSRGRLAALSASTGAVLSWNPTADTGVNAMVIAPGGTRVIVGGSFSHIGSTTARGMAALDPTTGALITWTAAGVVQDYGSGAAILSLTTDGTSVFGSGYNYKGTGNLEGAFSADPISGAIKWIEDCHGDTYSVFSSGAALYTVSHAHYCGNFGGFPQSNPWSINQRHAIAFTLNATGTIAHDPYGYHDWYGNPSPSIINWFPDLTVGTYTGQSQAAWSVTGNSQYLVLGGEFPKVNGTSQQGLARFATTTPNKTGPRLASDTYVPTATSTVTGQVKISWPSNWDRDDYTLTYKVVRNGNSSSPIYTKTSNSTFWTGPTMTYTDTGLTSGSVQQYRIYVNDAAGNKVTSNQVSVTVK